MSSDSSSSNATEAKSDLDGKTSSDASESATSDLGSKSPRDASESAASGELAGGTSSDPPPSKLASEAASSSRSASPSRVASEGREAGDNESESASDVVVEELLETQEAHAKRHNTLELKAKCNRCLFQVCYHTPALALKLPITFQ